MSKETMVVDNLRQKTLYLDCLSYGFVDLLEEVGSLYPLDENMVLSLFFLDKWATTQSFIQIVDDSTYRLMVQLHKEKKEVVIYTTKEDVDPIETDIREGGRDREVFETDNGDNMNYDECSDYCHSEESYHSRHSDLEEELDLDLGYEGDLYVYNKDDPKMETGAIFPNVAAFRRALNHYAVTQNLMKSDLTRVTAGCMSLECNWRIHASITQDEVTFEVRTMQPTHTCHGSYFCRAWQVKGVPCVHAAAFIASIRNVKWEEYVDSYFTVARFKAAYSSGVAPMPSRNEWSKVDLGYAILPPILKRPTGRPRKNRIRASGEPKKRSHKCNRCGAYGHHRNTCKNAVPPEASGSNTVDAQSVQGSNVRRGGKKGKRKANKRACPPDIFKLLEEQN